MPRTLRIGIDLAEQILAAMWRNYQAARYSRLTFISTVIVLQRFALTAALGADVHALGVLLTARDSTVAELLVFPPGVVARITWSFRR